MLKLELPPLEFFNEQTSEFISTKPTTLQLEHSLVSLSKWESKWCKPFLKKEKKSFEELLDYVRCMTITQNVNPMIYKAMPASAIDAVTDYISAPMTATTFPPSTIKKTDRETITSELIYYWMISLNIPFECQKWHLNRLMTLINVCGFKNSPPKKMSKSELAARNRALNAQRLAKYHTRG